MSITTIPNPLRRFLPTEAEARAQFAQAGLNIEAYDPRETGYISYPRVAVLASDGNLYTCDLLRDGGGQWHVEDNTVSNTDKLKAYFDKLIASLPCEGTNAYSDTCGVTYTCLNCNTVRELRLLIAKA